MVLQEFGRRPVYLGTMVVLLASQLLQMNVENEGQYIGSCVLIGLGAAPFDVLVEISVSRAQMKCEAKS